MSTAGLTILLAVLVLALPSPSDLTSIRPLQRTITHPVTGAPTIQIICTTWAAYSDVHQRVWVTAAHCVFDEQGEVMLRGLMVDEKSVAILAVNGPVDLALLRGGPTGVAPLRVAQGMPSAFQPVWAAGYALGATRQHLVVGIFSNAADDDHKALYNLAVAPGMSGAPILDQASGQVVGVLTQSECPAPATWCPMSKGTPLHELRNVLGVE
ncbi:MAG: serine protease [Vicinamibacterales bacterium]